MSDHETLELRRALLGAFVEPARVIETPVDQRHARDATGRHRLTDRELEIAADRALWEPDDEPEPTCVRCVIVEGNVPAPMRTADASIELGVALDAIVAKHGFSREDAIGMLAVVALRVAARPEAG